MKKHIVVLTGAGISAESGIQTFRGAGGLWNGHDIMEVASPEGWNKNPQLVLDFYNKRRQDLKNVTPNLGHKALVDLEAKYDVTIITQNVDDLHERAGSSNIIHLHGELLKVRSIRNEDLIYTCHRDIHLGDIGEDGSQLRPHIVWFGEAVPMIERAAAIASKSDIFIVIGTSMAVYPAAGLIHYVNFDVPKYVIDPNKPEMIMNGINYFQEKATLGVPKLVNQLLNQA